MIKKASLLILVLIIFVLITSQDSKNKNDMPMLKIDAYGHSAMVHNITFSPDGTELITSSQDKTIKIWDTKSGELKRNIRGYIQKGNEGMYYAIAVDNMCKYIAAGGWFKGLNENDGLGIGAIRIFDYKTGKMIRLLKEHTEVVFSLAFSPDNKLLASLDKNGKIKLWNINTFKEKIKFNYEHIGYVFCFAFNTDGSKIVIASSNNQSISIKILDTKTGKILSSKNNVHDDFIYQISFSPDDKYITTAGDDGKLKLWNSKNIDFIKIIKDNPSYNISNVKFFDSSTIICGGTCLTYYNKKWIRPVYIININNGSEKVFYAHTNTIQDIAISKVKKIIASTGGNNSETVIWDPYTLQVKNILKGKGGTVWGCAFGLDNETIYFGNKNASLSYFSDPSIEKSFNFKNKKISNKINNSKFKSVKFSHDGKKIKFSGYKYGKAFFYISGKKIELPKYRDTLRSCTYTWDGKYVIAGSDFGLYKIDPVKNEVIDEFIGHEGSVFSVSVSQDSKTLVSGGNDQTLRLWDIDTCKLLVTIFIGDDNEWIAFTPDGYFECSLDGAKYAGWHFNRGEEHEAEFFTLEQYQSIFYRPDIIEMALNRKYIDLPKVSFNTKPPVITSFSINEEKNYQENVIAINTDKHEFNFSLNSSGEFELSHVDLFYNGRIISQSSYKGEPSVIFSKNNKKLSANYTFQVSAKESNYKVMIIDKKGFSSREKKIKIIYTGKNAIPAFYKLGEKVSLPKPDKTLHVISIGINDYIDPAMDKAGLKDLKFAEKDAKDIAALFISQEGRFYQKVETTLLTKKNKGRDILRNDILKVLKNIGKKLKENDSIVLFMSSHGLRNGNDYYLLSSECDPTSKESLKNSSISWEEIGEILKGYNDAKEIVVIVDACHSGIVNMIELGNKWKNKGITLFASCKDTQQSYEDAVTMNGYFTKAIIEGFTKVAEKNIAPADTSQDNVLIIGEVLNYAIEKVGEWSGGRQTPWVPAYDPSIEGKILGIAR